MSIFVVAVYAMSLSLPATATPQRGVTDTAASALGSSSVVNVSAEAHSDCSWSRTTA